MGVGSIGCLHTQKQHIVEEGKHKLESLLVHAGCGSGCPQHKAFGAKVCIGPRVAASVGDARLVRKKQATVIAFGGF